VVEAAQGHEVIESGGATVRPVLHMVSIGKTMRGTTGILAAATVADAQAMANSARNGSRLSTNAK
tara:strand:+ start:651 stop:845 length:195 start_codon:yes stop_codon:yes gene_type:complete